MTTVIHRSAKIVLCAAVLTLGGGVSAGIQAAVLYSSLSTRELSVGDRVHLSVTIMTPKGAVIIPPEPSVAFGPVTVKEWNSRKFEHEKADSTVFEYAITTYKPEPCTIPALPYVIESGDKRDTLKTEPLPLTLIPQITTDSADIMDLRPQQITGKRPLWWLWTLIAAAVLAAGILTARHYLRRSKRPLPPPPPKPPYDEAIEALAALDAKQYLLKGLIRDYVFELSDIIKRYIERRYGINAAEFTTEEMLAWLGVSPLEKPQRAAMEWFFRATDPVKFAKLLPDQQTIERFGAEVRSFLDATKPAAQPDTTSSAQTTTPKDGSSA